MNDPTYKRSNGQRMKIRDMHDRHLHAAIVKLERISKSTLIDNKLYEDLKEEFQRRNRGLVPTSQITRGPVHMDPPDVDPELRGSVGAELEEAEDALNRDRFMNTARAGGLVPLKPGSANGVTLVIRDRDMIPVATEVLRGIATFGSIRVEDEEEPALDPADLLEPADADGDVKA